MSKDSDKIRKVGDMVLDFRESARSIKKHPFLKVEFDANRVKSIFKRMEFFLGIFAVLIVFVSILMVSNFTSANVAIFYPDNCLGTALNSTLASGSYNEGEEIWNDNSAHLDKQYSEIYCGGFKGEIPDSASPYKFTLHISAKVTDTLLTDEPKSLLPEIFSELGEDNTPEPKEEQIDNIPQNENLDIQAIQDNVQQENGESNNQIISPTEQIPEEISIPEQTQVEIIPDNTNDIVSWLFLNKVYAEDEPQDLVSDIQNIDPIIEPPIEPIIEQTTEPVSQPIIEQILPEIAAEPETQIESINANSIAELSYTIDGSTWVSLGKKTKEEIENGEFDLPLLNEELLNTMEFIQIKLQFISDDIPLYLYINNMSIDIEYEDIQEEEKKEIIDEIIPEKELYRYFGEGHIYDETAKQKCTVEPFSANILQSGDASYSATLSPSYPNSPFRIGFGNLPIGVHPSLTEVTGTGGATIPFSFIADVGSPRGSYNIMFVYREIQTDGKELANFCQLNLVID